MVQELKEEYNLLGEMSRAFICLDLTMDWHL